MESDDSALGGIEASTLPDDRTRLDFRDAISYGLLSATQYAPIGRAFEEFCQMVIGEAELPAQASEYVDDLDAIDRKIVEVVQEIEATGRIATDELVAKHLPLNPDKQEPYHRVTINRRRNKLRDRGYEV